MTSNNKPSFSERVSLVRDAVQVLIDEVQRMEASEKRFAEQREGRTQKARR